MRSLFGLGRTSLMIVTLLYGALASGANPAAAAGLTADDRAALSALSVGDMKRLVIHDTPRPAIETPFTDGYGAPVSMADYRGKVVVVNFWATWCPPCVAEMPSIDRLSRTMASVDLSVIALSVDRAPVRKIVDFYEANDIQFLPVLQDKRMAVAREVGALGLPVTLILDREGREIARYEGEAAWDGAEVKALLTRIVEMTAPEA